MLIETDCHLNATLAANIEIRATVAIVPEFPIRRSLPDGYQHGYLFIEYIYVYFFVGHSEIQWLIRR